MPILNLAEEIARHLLSDDRARSGVGLGTALGGTAAGAALGGILGNECGWRER